MQNDKCKVKNEKLNSKIQMSNEWIFGKKKLAI